MKLHDDPLTDPDEVEEEQSGDMTPAARARRAAALRLRADAAVEGAKKAARDFERFVAAARSYTERAAALEAA